MPEPEHAGAFTAAVLDILRHCARPDGGAHTSVPVRAAVHAGANGRAGKRLRTRAHGSPL